MLVNTDLTVIIFRKASIYDEQRFSQQGPKLLTSIVDRKCGKNKRDIFTPWISRQCDGFDILPPEVGLGVPWLGWFLLYDPDKLAVVNRMIESSFAVHLWNHMRSVTFSPIIRMSHPVYRLFLENCPVNEAKVIQWKANKDRYWN